MESADQERRTHSLKEQRERETRAAISADVTRFLEEAEGANEE